MGGGRSTNHFKMLSIVNVFHSLTFCWDKLICTAYLTTLPTSHLQLCFNKHLEPKCSFALRIEGVLTPPPHFLTIPFQPLLAVFTHIRQEKERLTKPTYMFCHIVQINFLITFFDITDFKY